MAGRDVDQVHAVSILQQPCRVHAGTAPHIQDPPWRWWQMSTKDLTCPDELQFREATGEAVLFTARVVVRNHAAEIVGHHARP
jgi:hypothetical protein